MQQLKQKYEVFLQIKYINQCIFTQTVTREKMLARLERDKAIAEVP